MNEIPPNFEATIETPLKPTEDSYLVLKCLTNIFPEAEWEVGEDHIKGHTTSLRKFSDILRDTIIRDTARDVMLRKSDNNRCRFVLSKQSSCSSRVNFFDGPQPLGSITVEVNSDNIQEVIGYLTGEEDNR